MPVILDSTEEVGVFSSIGVSIEGVGQPGERRFLVNVPQGAAALLVTITAGGLDGVNLVAPVAADVRLFNPQNERVNFQFGPGGQIFFAETNPSDGTWTLLIAYNNDASVELNATTLHPGWIEYLRGLIKRFGLWVGCKACKRLVKALVVGGLISLVVLAPHATIEAIIHDPILVGTLSSVLAAFITDEKALERFLELLRKHVKEPLDKLAERACQVLGFCPA